MDKCMFHVIRSVGVVDSHTLCAQFDCGVIKTYDIDVLIKDLPIFKQLIVDHKLFKKVHVDVGGYGLIWNKEIDLSSEEVWNNGKVVFSNFNNLLSFSDAAALWQVEESTLRKAVSYGKLVPGIDCCKYGKQWVVSVQAMNREYGKTEYTLNNSFGNLEVAEKPCTGYCMAEKNKE